MTNFRKSLSLTLIGAGLCFSAVQPALCSDLDDMLKKYPQVAPGADDPTQITGTEARMMNGIRRHISKLYSLIGSSTRSGKLNADQAAQHTAKVSAVEDTIREMNSRPFFKYDGAQDGTQQLNYGDMQTLVQMIGQEEADLGDALAPKKAKNAPANAPTPPAVSVDNPPPPVKEVGPHYGTPSSRLTYGGGPRKDKAAAPAPTTTTPEPARPPAPVSQVTNYPSYQARPVQKRFDESFRNSSTSSPSREASGGDSRFQQLFNAK